MIFPNPTFLQHSITPLFCNRYFTLPLGSTVSRLSPHLFGTSYHPDNSRLVVCPRVVSTMLDNISATILNQHKSSCNWQQPLLFHDGKVELDLSVAIGANVITPSGASNQPTCFPNWSKYRFDNTVYSGTNGIDALVEKLKGAMSGCITNLFQNQLDGRIAYQLKCQFYRTKDPHYNSVFSPGKFTKEGVTTERNKGRNGSTKSFLRMNTSKMKNKPTKSTLRALSRKKNSKTPPKPTARRNDAHHADSTSSRCKAQIVFILHEASGDIYLGSKKSSLQH